MDGKLMHSSVEISVFVEFFFFQSHTCALSGTIMDFYSVFCCTVWIFHINLPWLQPLELFSNTLKMKLKTPLIE